MKSIFAASLTFIVALHAFSQHAALDSYPFQPVPFNRVFVNDDFWAPRIETNRKVTIPYDFRKCEETGRIDNFAKAGKVLPGTFKGNVYDDSDVYKLIEGASYSLQQQYDKKLDAYLDSIIGLIIKAQEPDGYLYTARTIDPTHVPDMGGSKRWEKELIFGHELYNVGHLYEAAVAHYLATGKKELLNAAIQNANLICNTFGPDKLQLVPGHQEIELALVKLFGVTGNKKYVEMAKFFIDQRGNAQGHPLIHDGENCVYAQDHLPVLQQDKAVGHAVRGGYLYAGMADVAAITHDKGYIEAIDRIWNNLLSTNMYLTGGVGIHGGGEGYGKEYQLPNLEAYNETCAAVAQCLWNYRMFLLHGKSNYFDVFERILYNGFLSGVSLEGDRFFYPNPLASNGDYERSPWFDTSCCPTNVARFLPSVPGYIYASNGNKLYVNLFIGNTATVDVGGNPLKIKMQTNYPWDGRVKITVLPTKKQDVELHIRIPGWALNQPIPSDLYRYADNQLAQPVVIKINGTRTAYVTQNGYAVVKRCWKNNDEVTLNLPMNVRRVKAHPNVLADRNMEAWQRGPIVYCFEGIDNGGDVSNVSVSNVQKATYTFRPDLLKGVGTLRFTGIRYSKDPSNPSKVEPTVLTAIPYYAWAHRGKGTMRVWLPFECIPSLTLHRAGSIQIKLPANSGPIAQRASAILAREITERSGAKVITKGKADLTVSLRIENGIGEEGFKICDDKNHAIEITGNDENGLLHGVGKFLHTSQYDQDGFTPATWRGTSVPKSTFRGIYFATHFNNWYEVASDSGRLRYMEDLALWGYNALLITYPNQWLSGINDPKAQEWLRKMKFLMKTARSVGMKTGIIGGNEAYTSAPKELRGEHAPWVGETPLCPNKPGATELLISDWNQLLDEFKEIGIDYCVYWPRDEGGCGCKQCAPWGGNAFPKLCKEMAKVQKARFPESKVILSTWLFDCNGTEKNLEPVVEFKTDGEYAGLTRFLEKDKSWVDYLMIEGHNGFPKFPLELGVPGKLPVIGFPEITMYGQRPWGGYGANPLPKHFQKLWDECKHLMYGGFPYSEGLFEDMNKIIYSQFYWNPDQSAMETVKAYISYEYSPEVVDLVSKAVELIEHNHNRIVTVEKIITNNHGYKAYGEGSRLEFQNEDYSPLTPEGIQQLKQSSQEAVGLLQQAEAKLTPKAKASWRWRILYLRAVIDCELARNDGWFQGKVLKEAFDELAGLTGACKSPMLLVQVPWIKDAGVVTK